MAHEVIRTFTWRWRQTNSIRKYRGCPAPDVLNVLRLEGRPQAPAFRLLRRTTAQRRKRRKRAECCAHPPCKCKPLREDRLHTRRASHLAYIWPPLRPALLRLLDRVLSERARTHVRRRGEQISAFARRAELLNLSRPEEAASAASRSCSCLNQCPTSKVPQTGGKFWTQWLGARRATA